MEKIDRQCPHPLDFSDFQNDWYLEQLFKEDENVSDISYEEWEKIELAEQEKRRRKNEIPALLWLAEILKIDDRKLSMVLNQVRDGPYPYRTLTVRKSGGGKRELSIPSESLKRIQRRINKKILCDFPIA